MIFNTAHTKNSIDMDVICLHLSTCIRTIKNLLSIGFLFTGCCRVTRMGDNWPCVGAELNATSYKQHSVFTCWRLSWHGKYFLKGFKMEQINNDVCLYLIWVFPSRWGRQTELWSSWEPPPLMMLIILLFYVITFFYLSKPRWWRFCRLQLDFILI